MTLLLKWEVVTCKPGGLDLRFEMLAYLKLICLSFLDGLWLMLLRFACIVSGMWIEG